MTNTISLGWRLLLSLIVAIGIAVAWGFVMVWLGGLIDNATAASDSYEQFYVTVDGEPVILRMSARASAQEQVLTLAGQPKQVSSQDLLHASYVPGPDTGRGWGEPPWANRIASANDGGAPATYWYLVHDGRSHGRAYGIGYHSLTGQVVGYFGRQGFSNSPPPAGDWFQVAGHYGLWGATGLSYGAVEPIYAYGLPRFLLIADGKLWNIDVAQRQIRSLLDCPTAYQVSSAWQLLAEVPRSPEGLYRQAAQSFTPQTIILRQPESIVILSPQGTEQRTVPIPLTLQPESLAVFDLPDDTLLLIAQPRQPNTPYRVVWLDAGGQIVKEQQVRLTGYWRETSDAEIAWRAVVAAPVPAALGVGAIAYPYSLVEQGKADSYGAALRQFIGNVWPTLFVVIALGAIAATASYRRQKRFGLPHAAVWAAFALLLGVPGWLAYRYHRSWPALSDCPSCGQAAPRDREACIDCGAAFPPPPLKGIEVFA
jgi:hypothetical protein